VSPTALSNQPQMQPRQACLAVPKSSPKRITAKKAWKSPPPRLSFSARLLRIHALTVKKHHNLLIGRHLPTPAFYSAVFQNALAGLSSHPASLKPWPMLLASATQRLATPAASV